MLTRCLPAVLVAGALLPAVAAADPVTLGLQSTPSRTIRLNALLPGGAAVPGGALSIGAMTPSGSAVLLSLSGLTANNNYTMELLVYGAKSSWNTLRTEVFDSLGGGNRGGTASSSQAMVARGFSSSGGSSGFAFGQSGSQGNGQSSGLHLGTLYGGGGPTGIAEEIANATNVLIFTAVVWGSSPLQVSFGFRDSFGGASFLALASAHDGLSPSPEPASVLLIGTGLAGLAALRRRRRPVQ